MLAADATSDSKGPNSVWDIRILDETLATNDDAAALARSGTSSLRPAVLRYPR